VQLRATPCPLFNGDISVADCTPLSNLLKKTLKLTPAFNTGGARRISGRSLLDHVWSPFSPFWTTVFATLQWSRLYDTKRRRYDKHKDKLCKKYTIWSPLHLETPKDIDTNIGQKTCPDDKLSRRRSIGGISAEISVPHRKRDTERIKESLLLLL